MCPLCPEQALSTQGSICDPDRTSSPLSDNRAQDPRIGCGALFLHSSDLVPLAGREIRFFRSDVLADRRPALEGIDMPCDRLSGSARLDKLDT